MTQEKYGVSLRSSKRYSQLFGIIRRQIRKKVGPDVLIEHVGGTSLREPSGKGDLDIYMGYKNPAERRVIEKHLRSIFGQEAKRTPIRTRFNMFFHGVEIEVQLGRMKAVRAAVALRDYLQRHPTEAHTYAKKVTQLRKVFLAKMYSLKGSFSKKALKELNSTNG